MTHEDSLGLHTLLARAARPTWDEARAARVLAQVTRASASRTARRGLAKRAGLMVGIAAAAALCFARIAAGAAGHGVYGDAPAARAVPYEARAAEQASLSLADAGLLPD